MMTKVTRRDFLKVSAKASLLIVTPDFAPGATGGPLQASISVNLKKRIGKMSPNLYGQFIEHLGRCIRGGIYEEGSPLSDSRGYRLDVLEKVRRLGPTLLRYPGGTFTKIYHWIDGVGTKTERPRRRNLIWGGEEDNQFGTNEFVNYCRLLDAQPFLAVNMATGTAEEAANWVEYCNGTGSTHYADLRRSHGFIEPHGVKYWGLGNEEYAEPDPGRLQEPDAYVKAAWQFAKLMKLQDPTIKLVMAGHDEEWNRRVLNGLHPVCDFLSLHFYAHSTGSSYCSLFENIAGLEQRLNQTRSLLQSVPERVQEFSRWYRFPAREQPVQLAIDEWGIWEDGGKGTYDLEFTFSWKHALATATLLNLFHRHCDLISLATWAQIVNVLAPIMTNEDGSICQTVFHPLELYRRHCGNWGVYVGVDSDALDSEKSLPVLDVSASYGDERQFLTVAVVNRHPTNSVRTTFEFIGVQRSVGGRIYELTAPSYDSSNGLESLQKDVVKLRTFDLNTNSSCTFPPCSISLCECQL
jgi:alpha-N-arabinofuranosidase